ncbi:MAG: PfaD family polyunsaturated fatty acid/polyketide biosynthesis protein, partial [Planctomycetes bacterium]|nr:PfaD family polyunsaturated fatty acid/polyketide biosynthesis protein [Planctomycetota bacterium]
AGAFDFDTGLKLVQKRGELMGQTSGGGMAAVLSLSVEFIQDLLNKNKLTNIDLANFNTPTQIVISGLKEDIQLAVALLEETDGRVIPLNVSAPFHSRYMDSASKAFAEFTKNFTFSAPDFPVIANATARPYEPEKVSELLASQIVSSVLWTDSIRYLMGLEEYLQFTESNTQILTGMVNDIQKNCTPLNVAELQEPNGETVAVLTETDTEEPDRSEPLKDVHSNSPIQLGNKQFCDKYGLKYPYIAGGMYRGIGSKEIVVTMSKAGMIGYLGTGGMKLGQIEEDIRWIQEQLTDNQSYGMNLLYNIAKPQMEEDTVDLYLKYGIRFVEAAAYLQISPPLVKYRLAGLKRVGNGRVICEHHILAKCSRPEIAEQFLSPAPERVVKQLLEKGAITSEQAEMAKAVPMAHDICVEADSGGHTDMGIPTVLLPAMMSLRKQMVDRHAYHEPIFMGLAGGIGAPQSALAAFIMGADFILTGSINQCTVEAGTSDVVKDMLQDINIQDTDYAPAGDMFEMGAKVQVLRRSVFFPARANKLFQIYNHFNNLDQIPEKIRLQIQDRYF